MAHKVFLKNVRIAFAHDLWVATNKSDDPNAPPKYGCTFLLDPANPLVIEINKAIEAAAQEKWGAKAAVTLKALRATEKAALRDGDLKTYAGYPGNLYVSCSNTIRPTIIDTDKTQLAQADGKPYSGCFVNASVEFWAYDVQTKSGPAKGISCSVLGVQFSKDGEKFGSGSSAADPDEFEDISEGADADDLS
jgi:hypothetical protein